MSASQRNVVDSSGWLEYFANAKNAQFFAPPIENTKNLIVPVISIHEVFKYVMRNHSEQAAFEFIECMTQSIVVDLDLQISLNAAKLGITNQMPLADSIIYATALAYDATVWTQDADFQDLPHVQYIAKNS